MNYKRMTIGLVSISVLLSACTSIRNSPGYRSNITEDGFQRSSAVKGIDNRMVGVNRPRLKPATEHQTVKSTPPRGQPTYEKQNRQQDVELILGDRNYYQTNVKAPSIAKGRSRKGGAEIALNFERASIREVVKVVLGDILRLSYTVEPGVEGEVTISSNDPLPRSSLIPTLESLLQTQGAVMYQDGNGGYRIASRSNLKGRGFKPSTGKLKPGYGMQIIPLRYIPAVEMQKILEPLANADAFIRVDNNRNLLILAGTSAELANLMATVKTFDVDVLKGMSVGIFRIKKVEAAVIAKHLEALFGESGSSPMAGMVKIVPIEHMNSIMIISVSPDYVKEMKRWIDRFDRVSETAGQQLYVYQVQNGSAENLAEMLTQVFSGKGSSKKRTPSSLAPGLQPATLGGDGSVETSQAIPSSSSTEGVSINTDEEVRIVADKTNNSLMILSTDAMYQQILEALKRIDIMPMQVQVEASILEVSLTDNLSYGLQWYFKNNVFGQQGGGGFSVDGGQLSVGGAGFSYSLSDPSGMVRAVLNTLAKQSKLRVISSPSLLVLDNQTAEIRVGNQQPVFSETTTTDGGVKSQSVQFKDTGVSLKVTPHVNSSGLVKMDIQQEVTDVGEIDQATSQRSFLQRNIKSSIAVQSGETVVLGGLIRENKTDGRTGVPVLSNVPIVGNLFNSKTRSGVRTELLVLITPTAIKDQKDLVKTGEEMRERMKRLIDGDRFIDQLRGQYGK